jgi:hypothetical protein
VALCDEHNPKHLVGPSATQMHATVFGGIALGVVGLFLLFNLLASSTGPYEAEVTSREPWRAGAVSLAFTVLNAGETEGVADCRVTRDGIPRPDDLAFRTPRVPAGGSVAIEKVTPAPLPESVHYDLDSLTVVCT